jgi:dipeptidyl aminopeptidase/acylaminoacyl peptidase
MSRANRVLLLAALFSWSVGAMAVEKLPVETFSRHFVYDSAQISPDGSKLAVSFLRDDTAMVAVVDLTAGKAVGVAGVKSPDTLRDIRWKSDQRLIYLSIRHNKDAPYFPILAAVDVDGANHVVLNFNPQRNGLYTYDWVVDSNWADPQNVLIGSETAKLEFPIVYRTDVMHSRGTGELMHNSNAGTITWPTSRKPLFNAPGRSCDYLTDNAGVVRTCLTTETDTTNRLLYRSGDGAEWVELGHFGYGGSGSVQPVAFAADNRTLYVFSTLKRDTQALYVFDPEKKALGDLIFEAAGADVDEVIFGGDQHTPVAVTYFKKGMGIHYLDERLAEVHQALNGAFKGQQVQLVSFSRDNSKVVVWVGDSSTPGSYYIYDTKNNTVQKVADRAPWIDRTKMAMTRAVEFDARDGLHLNGYLTLPRGAEEKGLPLIVQVHGGPLGVRDTATFDSDTQFLANRGYAVLQVNFRGSAGYGTAFVGAAQHEWGGKMQTDLEDGVKWLVARGTVDPNRVGIFGGSYGGYAAMMALAAAPDMFKCGISEDGVANLVRMLNSTRIEGKSGDWGRRVTSAEQAFWQLVIGNRRDEATLKAVSPVFNVDKIKAPLFLAHGSDDLVVPSVESTDMESAMKRAGKPVELLVVPGEGHGIVQEKNRKVLYERLDAFLAKNLPTT